jgi:hypothetical protein
VKRDAAYMAIFVAGIAFGAVLMYLWLSPSLVSAAPAPMRWSELQRSLQLVEQQGNIVNPTDCAWDVDDRIDGIFTGVLWKDESVSHSECVILDDHTHLVGLSVGEGLAGSIEVGGTSASACLLTPEYGDPEYLALPAIGEGHGEQVNVTWSVTNISGHRLGKASAFTTIHFAGAC